MKYFFKIKAFILVLLCFTMAVSMFCAAKNTLPAYAYTDEEKAAVKAWLSENGYPPTMAGAEQAYQDYLDGKFGPVGGNDAPPEEIPPETDEGTTGSKTETGAGAQQETPVSGSEEEQQETTAPDTKNESKEVNDERAAARPKTEVQKPEDTKQKDAVAEKNETGGTLGKEQGKDLDAVKKDDEKKSDKETALQADMDSSELAAIDAEGLDADAQNTDAQPENDGKISTVMLWIIVIVCAVIVCFLIAFFQVRGKRV